MAVMLEKETQIETKGREQNLYQIMMQMCLCIHILLMGFFACMQIWFMVTVNILSVLLYCFGVARIKTTKEDQSVAFGYLFRNIDTLCFV